MPSLFKRLILSEKKQTKNKKKNTQVCVERLLLMCDEAFIEKIGKYKGAYRLRSVANVFSQISMEFSNNKKYLPSGKHVRVMYTPLNPTFI